MAFLSIKQQSGSEVTASNSYHLPSLPKGSASLELMPQASHLALAKISDDPDDLLFTAIECWKRGDWCRLASLSHKQIVKRHGRELLAALSASGHLCSDNREAAREFFDYAREWGCPRSLLFDVMSDGVKRVFETAPISGVSGNSPIRDGAIFRDYLESLAKTRSHVAKAVRLFEVPCRVHGREIRLAFYAARNDQLRMDDQGILHYSTGNEHVYLVSNDHGSFATESTSQHFSIARHTNYRLLIFIKGRHQQRPIIWAFEYVDGKRKESHNWCLDGDCIVKNFTTGKDPSSIAFGIRLAGEGTFDTRSLAISLEIQEQTSKQDAQNQITNSTRQIESYINLKDVLGRNLRLPPLHGWAISPDVALLLVQLVSEYNYDAVVEFGSGASTLVLAGAVRRKNRKIAKKISRILSIDHSGEYLEKTRAQLASEDLEKYVTLAHCPLIAWEDQDYQCYSYYDCDRSLDDFRRQLPSDPRKVLIFVDGPPGSTGKNARHPALSHILNVFGPVAEIDFLMDDYIRDDERAIVQAWEALLNTAGFSVTKEEFLQFEKQACLLRARRSRG